MARAGMDIEAVETIGHQLQQRAAQLDGLLSQLDSLVHQLPSQWQGQDCDMFVQHWWPQHRGAFTSAVENIRGLGQSALNNAADQRQTSLTTDAGGLTSGQAAKLASLMATVGAISGAAQFVSDIGPFVGYAGLFADATGLDEWSGGVIGAAGIGFSAVSVASDMWLAVNDFGAGRPVDGTLEVADAVASGLKEAGKKDLPLYVAGVAVATWVEAGKDAEKVDWSPAGLAEIANASPADWGAGFSYAMQQLTGVVVKVLAP